MESITAPSAVNAVIVDAPSSVKAVVVGEPSSLKAVPVGEPSSLKAVPVGAPSSLKAVPVGAPSSVKAVPFGAPSSIKAVAAGGPGNVTSTHKEVGQALVAQPDTAAEDENKNPWVLVTYRNTGRVHRQGGQGGLPIVAHVMVHKNLMNNVVARVRMSVKHTEKRVGVYQTHIRSISAKVRASFKV